LSLIEGTQIFDVFVKEQNKSKRQSYKRIVFLKKDNLDLNVFLV
jgi:hypothetical protein